MKSSSLLTDGALAKWEASKELGPGLRAHFGIQESGVQELENLERREFRMLVRIRIKTLLAILQLLQLLTPKFWFLVLSAVD